MTFPSESKDESREPSVLYLATANSLLDPLFEKPATTIFPLLSIAIELADSCDAPNTVITFPSESKDVSRDPLACAGFAPTPTNNSDTEAKTPRKDFCIPLIYATNQ